jgi:hypothetical protein
MKSAKATMPTTIVSIGLQFIAKADVEVAGQKKQEDHGDKD